MKEITIPIYLNDLLPEKRAEVLELIGGIQYTNWDIIPITEVYMTLEGDDNNDIING